MFDLLISDGPGYTVYSVYIFIWIHDTFMNFIGIAAGSMGGAGQNANELD